MKVKKGDTIEVILGKDKGKKGKVDKALPKQRKVLVSGVNIVKKHKKSTSQQDPGGIIDVVKPIDVSKVALICPKCGLKVRIGYRQEEKSKIRICKKCREAI